MIFKLSVLAALVAPLVSALTVNAPSQAVTSGGSMTFTWSIKDGDPSTFSVFLKNPSFNSVFGVANSVDATLLTLTLAVPSVPENQQYTIELVPINNSQQVLAESPSFTIGSVVTGTTASTTISSTSARSVTSAATTSVSLSTLRGTPISTPSAPTGFGTTVSAVSSATSATAPASSGSAAPASSSPANSAALPVRFNMNMGMVASMALSVFAGAAVVAL